jgi:hypothetical protein
LKPLVCSEEIEEGNQRSASHVSSTHVILEAPMLTYWRKPRCALAGANFGDITAIPGISL